jgi:ATP-binding cassette subfamily C (CFTR/MRP) protein 1
MRKVIREEWKDKTIIAVAHRLNSIMDFDRIAVLEKGCLVEFDTPGNLIRREGGMFQRLWNSQV